MAVLIVHADVKCMIRANFDGKSENPLIPGKKLEK